MENTTATEGKAARLWQFIKFSLVGVLNTLISEGVYAVLLFFKMHYLPASFIGFFASVLNAYYWNNKYVFKEQEDKEKRVWWQTLCKTFIAYFWGYIAHAALLAVWIDLIRIGRWLGPAAQFFAAHGLEGFDVAFLEGIIAAALNLIITVPMNFIINKYWAFKQKEK